MELEMTKKLRSIIFECLYDLGLWLPFVCQNPKSPSLCNVASSISEKFFYSRRLPTTLKDSFGFLWYSKSYKRQDRNTKVLQHDNRKPPVFWRLLGRFTVNIAYLFGLATLIFQLCSKPAVSFIVLTIHKKNRNYLTHW